MIFHHTTLQIFVLNWSPLRFSLMFFIIYLQVLRKLKKAAELKRYGAHLEWEGLHKLEMTLVTTHASWLVNLMVAGVHEADKPTPSPTAFLTTYTSLKEDEWTSQVLPLLSGITETIASPSRSSMLPTEMQKGTPVPCHIPKLALPPEAFKWFNLKDSSKMDMCKVWHRIS